MATHCSILAWEIGGLQYKSRKELETTEQPTLAFIVDVQ